MDFNYTVTFHCSRFSDLLAIAKKTKNMKHVRVSLGDKVLALMPDDLMKKYNTNTREANE